MTTPQKPQQHEPCAARTRGGWQCKLPAGWGTQHLGAGQCRRHGGMLPNNIKSAQRELARREATMFGARTDINPAEALLELVQTKAGEVAWWQTQVDALDNHQLAGMLISQTKTIESHEEVTRRAGINIHLQGLHDAQDQLAKYSEAAIRAGASEAIVKLVTRQAEEVIAFATICINMGRAKPLEDPNAIILELLDGR